MLVFSAARTPFLVRGGWGGGGSRLEVDFISLIATQHPAQMHDPRTARRSCYGLPVHSSYLLWKQNGWIKKDREIYI